MKMKTPFISAASVAVLAVITYIWLGDTDKATSVACVSAVKADFDIQVSTIGELDSIRSHRVASEIRGNKGKIIFLAQDGSNIKAGDVLVRFDPTPFEQKLLDSKGDIEGLRAIADAMDKAVEIERNSVEQAIKNAEFDIKGKRQSLLKLTEGEAPVQISEYENDVEKARSDLSEQQSFVHELNILSSKGFSNIAELSRAKKKRISLQKVFNIAEKKMHIYSKYILPSLIEERKSSLKHAESSLEKIQHGGLARIARALSIYKKSHQDVLNAEDAYKRSLIELGKTTVHAPFDGIVVLLDGFYANVRRKPRIGDNVIQNAPILALPDTSAYMVNTKVREIDLHKVSIHQQVEVQVDAFPGLKLIGEVNTIGALAQKDLGRGQEKFFHIRILLKQTDPHLRPGMTVRSTVSSDQVRNALLLPVSALFYQANKTIVYQCGTGTPITIKQGRHNEDWVEILDGISEGERLRVSAPNHNR